MWEANFSINKTIKKKKSMKAFFFFYAKSWNALGNALSESLGTSTFGYWLLSTKGVDLYFGF